MTGVLTRRGDERDTETHREESHVVTEAEIGVLQPPESIREACREQILLLNPQEGISPQFQTSGLQNCEKIQVFCSKPPGGTLKWLLEETNTETNTTRLVK